MTDLLALVKAERQALADDLARLSQPDWEERTWCTQWDVEDVVAHLTAAARVTFGHFALGFVRARFDFDRYVGTDLRAYRGPDPAATFERFTAVLDSERTPPGPTYVALGEVMVHGEDIRRPLGLRGEHPEEHLVTLAELYRNTGAPLGAKRRRAGLRLVATDVDWSTGAGLEVRGPCMSLILAMVGRPGALDDCEGEGKSLLRARCASR